MKKRLYRSLLLFVFLLSLTACVRKEKPLRIGVSQCSNDIWHEQLSKEMMTEATLSTRPIDIDFRCSHGNNPLQTAQVDSLANEGVDLIIVSPNEGNPLTPAVDRAFKRGIPIVVVDRKITSNNYTAFIGVDNRRIGENAALYIARELGEKGTVAEIMGLSGSSTAIERHEGFIKGLSRYPNIHIATVLHDDFGAPNAERMVDSLVRLKKMPDIVFACNDQSGQNLYRTAKKRGIHLRIVGVDGIPSADGGLDGVKKGELIATFVNPTGGDKVIHLARQILDGKPFARHTELTTALITPKDIAIFLMQFEQLEEYKERAVTTNKQLLRSLATLNMQHLLLITGIVILGLLVALIYIAVRFYSKSKNKNKQLLYQKEKLEKQRDHLVKISKQLEETTRSKLNLFTAVSHDLRTPLTLIATPIEQLQADKTLSEKQRKLLALVQNNIGTLKHLTSQMLDLHNAEEGRLTLSRREMPLTAVVKKWTESFFLLARRQMIRFTVNIDPDVPEERSPMISIDEEKMESVVYNLISNSFKFTAEGGKISLTASLREDGEGAQTLVLCVKDTGIGIETDVLPYIFDLYYQTDVRNGGIGFGLSIVKTYVELHGGTIAVESTIGRGTKFTLTIPCSPLVPYDNLTYTLPKVVEDNAPAPVTDQPSTASVRESEETTEEEALLPLVLVIDDNKDICTMISLILDKEYRVECAVNGKEGIEKARHLLPDAVICDVMMPGISGWECCRSLKNGWKTAHIPIMMITADTEHRLTGYESGVDAYLIKPFSATILRSRLKNLIDNRKRLTTFFAEHVHTSTSLLHLNDPDKTFVERFRLVVKERMSDPQLSVDVLASEMNLGRSQLYRKIKSLTGFAPNELVRIARLKRAAQLLTQSERSVSEVAYDVGFSSAGYFAKCFREYFGVTPAEYVKQN